MAAPKVCTFKKEFLANTTLLYIEDEEIIRNDAIDIFASLFKEVFVAVDGEEGLELYKEHKDSIDIILTDINMPKLSGLDMISEIRNLAWDLPILITTGFKEPDLLLKAIKLNVTNYIIKPMQLNTTFKIISKIMEDKEREKQMKIQENELQQFMSILDSQNLICEFDTNDNIIFVNDLYITASGYTMDELLHMKHRELNHPNVPDNIYCNLIDSIQSGQIQTSECKKVTKTGITFFTHSTFLPIYSTDGKIKKFIEFAIPTTKYEKEILSLKKSILSLKSESFKSSLGKKSEQVQIENLTMKFQKQLDDSINGNQQLLFEIHELKKQNQELEEKLKYQEERFEEFQVKTTTL